ncbi:MAG: hypothetical protein HY788_06795 [Deltaproteobacteria bacterium]|nr:hypothetical protein [Deltaproteobacteria bacterium]
MRDEPTDFGTRADTGHAPLRMRAGEHALYGSQGLERTVTIEGRFMGWSGSCKTAPPETRSDWMVDIDKGCLYVSGPVPEGYSTVPGSASLGKTISVTGRVLLDKEQRPYVKTPAP